MGNTSKEHKIEFVVSNLYSEDGGKIGENVDIFVGGIYRAGGRTLQEAIENSSQLLESQERKEIDDD